MRSLLGSQAESRHETAPRYGFGTGQRAAYDIMYGGPGTDKGRPCRLSPGPIYMPGAGPNRGPKFSFGTGPAAGSCGSTANKGSAQEPGPGDYELSAAVGPQFSSLARTAPKFTWGSTVRDTGGAKVRATLGLPNATPLYTHAVAFLTTRTTTPPPRHARATQTHTHTRTADIPAARHTRLRSSGVAALPTCAPPSPRHPLQVSKGESGSPYELRASVGPQADSKKRNKPNYAFGTSQRFATGELRKSAAAPGPGSYAMPKAVETQQEPTKSMAVLYLLLHLLYLLTVLTYTCCAYCAHSRCSPITAQESTKKSMPAYGFGTSTRVQANMVYWKGKAGAAEGKDTPGPSYKLKSSVGGQVQSDRRSGSSFGFGSSARFGPPSKDRSPGPGEYNA